MIPVGVARQDVGPILFLSKILLHQGSAESRNACPRVDDEAASICLNLHAGGIAAYGAPLEDRIGVEVFSGLVRTRELEAIGGEQEVD